MLTQGEYMAVVALRRQGWTIGQVADAVDCHPAIVSSCLKKKEARPPSGWRRVATSRPSPISAAEAKLYKEWIDNERKMRRLIAQMRKVASRAGEIRLAEART